MRIEPMTTAHADAVLAIYQDGLDTGNASFETTAPNWETWDINHLPDHRYVAVDDDGKVVGWAASPVSSRCVYAGVIEHSVYIAPAVHGQGVGRAVLKQLVTSAKTTGVWTIETGIFPANTTSLALHEAGGFRVVGHRERIGQHHGVWRDTMLLEFRL
jgi:phosphinothricin acetyltransferase